MSAHARLSFQAEGKVPVWSACVMEETPLVHEVNMSPALFNPSLHLQLPPPPPTPWDFCLSLSACVEALPTGCFFFVLFFKKKGELEV